jgi:hypothetical protein
MTDPDALNARAPAALVPAAALVGLGRHRVPEDVYNADPCRTMSVRAGTLKTIREKSPRHAWLEQPRLNPNWEPDDRKQFDLGKTAHALVLGDLKAEFALFDLDGWQYAKKEDKADRQAAYDAGKIPLLVEQFESLRRMSAACHAQLENLADGEGNEIGNPLVDGEPEVTLVWQDEEFGLLCRARLDWFPNRVDQYTPFYDFKSTSGSANPEHAYRHLGAIGADLQAVHYSRGIKAEMKSRGIKWEGPFRFILQEIKEPYALSVVEPGHLLMEDAERDYRRAMMTWKRCLTENAWPGYTRRVVTMDPPAWAHAQSEEREQMDRLDNAAQREGFRLLQHWQSPVAPKAGA